MLPHRYGPLPGLRYRGEDVADDKNVLGATAAAAAAAAGAPAAGGAAAGAGVGAAADDASPRRTKIPQSAWRGRRSPLQGVADNGGAGAGGKRGTPKKAKGVTGRRALPARALSAAPPVAPPPSPMKPTDRPFRLDTDTDDY